MIVIKISGGVGNQLFQYSFGKFLSIKFNTVLKLDIQTKNNFSGFTNRAIGLDKFNVAINIANSEELKNYKFFNHGYLSRVERKLVQLFPFLNRRYIVELPNRDKFCINRISDNCYYDGYWQSEKYFKTIEGIIRKDLEFRTSLNNYNTVLLNEIMNTESISLHIRRGDYLTIKANTKIFTVCSVEYYHRAINYFGGKLKNHKFFIFSEDYEFAHQNFKGEQFRIIHNSHNPEIDIFLMSKCKHHIIANSSFSWWGAWLNQNPDKIVIAPKKWYKNTLNINSDELIPSEWIKL